MVCVADIRKVNADRVKLCIECCIQAYNAFLGKRAPTSQVVPPAGFELVDSWTGVDAVFGRHKTVEPFGLVFCSKTPPWRYIFAFRGTDSFLDMLDDCGVEPQAFTPFDAAVGVPADVRVESGFNDIYKVDDGDVASMQHQLFALVDKYQASTRPINEVYITGHSLGAALSQLFVLDLALSRPTIAMESINFASPRVGNGAYVDFVEQRCPCSILRVQNKHDAVPHLPPAELGFEHTPSVYLIAFYSTDILGKKDFMASHSSINYQAVITCAGENGEGVCSAKRLVVPQGKAPICSEHPDA